MTRATIVKRIAWAAAVLTLPMLTVSAYAGDHGNRHGKKQGQSQVQKHRESGLHKSRQSRKHVSVTHNRHRVSHNRHRVSHRSNFGHFGRHPTCRHNRHSSHRGIGFRISFGSHNRARVVYSNNYYNRSCCTRGYYTTRWVEPVTSVRYDDCDRPYTVVIRRGYYSQVWIPGRCSRGIHHRGGRY